MLKKKAVEADTSNCRYWIVCQSSGAVLEMVEGTDSVTALAEFCREVALGETDHGLEAQFVRELPAGRLRLLCNRDGFLYVLQAEHQATAYRSVKEMVAAACVFFGSPEKQLPEGRPLRQWEVSPRLLGRTCCDLALEGSTVGELEEALQLVDCEGLDGGLELLLGLELEEAQRGHECAEALLAEHFETLVRELQPDVSFGAIPCSTACPSLGGAAVASGT